LWFIRHHCGAARNREGIAMNKSIAYDMDDDNPYDESLDFDLNRKPPVNPHSDEYRDWVNRFDPYWK